MQKITSIKEVKKLLKSNDFFIKASESFALPIIFKKSSYFWQAYISYNILYKLREQNFIIPFEKINKEFAIQIALGIAEANTVWNYNKLYRRLLKKVSKISQIVRFALRAKKKDPREDVK